MMRRLLIVLIFFSIPTIAKAQTNTFCASNLSCNATGAWSFAQISGTQHVNANQTFASALAAASSPGAIVIDPGTYTVSTNATIPSTVTLVSRAGGLLSIATGITLTINGPIDASAQQLFVYVGTGTTAFASASTPLYANWFPGADMGAQLNNAYAALPSTGGQIFITPVGSNGCYSFTTPIVMNTSNKYAWIQGAEPTTSNPIAGSCLRYTPTTATTAITLDWTPNGGGGYAPSGGMRDITLVNGLTDCGTIGGCGSSAIGIQLGGTNAGTHKGFFQNVKVVGFLNNWKIVADANQVGWGVSWNNSNNSFCGTGINYTINHENDFFSNGVIASCATGVNLSPANFGGEFRVMGSSFDDNSTCAINMADGAVLSVTNSHFENGTQTTAYICGGATASSKVSVSGSIFYDLVSGGTNNTTWIKAGLIDINAQLESGLGGRVQNTSPIVANTSGFAYVTINPQMSFPTIPRSGTTIDITASNGGTSIFSPVHGFTEVATPSGGTIVNVGIDPFYGDSTFHGVLHNDNNTGWVPLPKTVALTADWTCGTGGTVASCTSATIIGSGGGVPLTLTLPLTATSFTLECNGVVGQATAATANQWNLLTATNGATNVTATYDMASAVSSVLFGAVTNQAATTTTFQIAPSWTLGGVGTKMPFHIWAKIEGASASGTVLSLQLLAPTVGDLVTIYRGTSCRIL